MPNLLSRTQAAVKAFWGGGNWVASDRPGNRSASLLYWGGRQFDYADMAGFLWLNSAVAACLNWQIRAWEECRVCVHKRNPDGTTQEVEGHPLTQLLARPNPFYTVNDLWAGTLLSYNCSPRAYWMKNRNARGRVTEVEYIPHTWLTPDVEDRDPRFVHRYRYDDGQKQMLVAAEDVISFRFAPDPCDMRGGMFPLQSVFEEVGTDKEATNYTFSVLYNKGIGLVVVPKDPNKQITDAPGLQRKLRDRISGRNRGETTVLEDAVEIIELGATPEKLVLDKIRKIPEARICAVTGVPAMVAGLSVGDDQRTYSNMEVATRGAYDRNFLPTQRVMGTTLTHFFLPEFNAFVPGNETYFVTFDNSQIKALQEDEEQTHKIVREDYRAGLIDRARAKTLIGERPDATDKDVYYPGTGTPDDTMLAPPAPPAPMSSTDTSEEEPQTPGKALALRYRERAELYRKFNPNHDPHSGEFAPSGGGGGAGGGDGSAEGNADDSEEPPIKKTRSEIAQQTSRRVDGPIQRYSEEHCEAVLASKLKGAAAIPNGKPEDVRITRDGVIQHGIELKTMTDNKNGKIRMKADAIENKRDWVLKHKAKFHTVVFDDHEIYNANGPGKHGEESKRVMYYRRGYGNYSIKKMHKVEDIAHLEKLLEMKIDDLPENAKPLKSYIDIGGQ